MRFGRAWVVAIIATLGASCDAASPPAYSVPELVPKLHVLDGKVVRVAGFLGKCAGYECNLFADEAKEHEFERAVDQLMRTHERHSWPLYLGIGNGPNLTFDMKARAFIDSYVIVTGRISDKCRDERNEPACMDRSTDIEPTDIQPWSGPGAPTKSN